MAMFHLGAEKLRELLLFVSVATVAIACEQSPFYVDQTFPDEGEEEVSRSTAIIVTFMSEGRIPEEFINPDYFKLVYLGRNYRPSSTASKRQSPSLADDRETESDATGENATSEETVASEDGGTNKRIGVYILDEETGQGRDKKQIKTRVALAPLDPLDQGFHRVSISAVVDREEFVDEEGNRLQRDVEATFETASTPGVKNPKIVSTIPEDLFAERNVELHPDQKILLMFDRPIGIDAVKEAIRLTLVGGLTQTSQAVDFQVRLHDNPEPQRANFRLREYEVELGAFGDDQLRLSFQSKRDQKRVSIAVTSDGEQESIELEEGEVLLDEEGEVVDAV